jgi:hypothetical protein
MNLKPIKQLKGQFLAATALIVITTSANSPAFAQTPEPINPAPPTAEDTAKAQTIRKLLEITGARNLYQQMSSQVFAGLKDQYPQVPAKFWDIAAQEMKTDEFLDEIIPIYQKYYTNDDLKQLVAFYQTPIGQKTISILPQLSRESIAAGLKFGRTVAKRITDKLKAEGYSPSPSSH